MNQVQITDTILRDAHQCLIATRLRLDDMLPICEKLDDVGFWALEAWGGATFDACVRFLKEDPWERLRQLRGALPKTRLMMLLRAQNLLGYRHYPDDVVHAFVNKAVENGVDVFRIFDALNDVRNMTCSIEAVRAAGAHAQGAIAYTTSPVHDISAYVTLASQLQELGCDSIAIKDMAGLLTPKLTAELVQALNAKITIPLHLHSHATSGLANLCQMQAIEQGCLHIDTAISAFSEGASHPCTESMVVALEETEHATGLDLPLLQEIADYFREVRKKYHAFESEATGIDTRVQVNQVPGGMISNLFNQLKQQGALDRMSEVQAEIPRVRAELGYPPLVTPTSQIVGTQAVLNVLTGERYKSITNEVKLYLQGRYGQAPGPVDPLVLQKAIGNETVIDVRPADLLKAEMPRLREEIGDLAQCEEDVLTYAMFPDVGRAFLQQRADGNLTPEPLEVPQAESTHSGSSLGQASPTQFEVTLHGETYRISIDGSGSQQQTQRPFFVTIDGLPEEILVQALDGPISEETGFSEEDSAASEKRPLAHKPGHVTTAMPGTVVDVLVAVGDKVTAGMPVLVTEAMKMETEIQAPETGTVCDIYVTKGDHVTPKEVLIEITV